jgi:hypothetical protein
MTEAWLLADRDALLAALGVRGAPDGWCVPDSPQDAESVSDPKATLERAVRECRRGRSTDVGRLYQPLSARVSLDRLKALRAYQEFWTELRGALRAQAFLSE